METPISIKKITLLLVLVLSSSMVFGQARESQEEVSDNVRLNLGLGAGLDYGGFGARLTLMTSEKFGIFGAVGYNLVGAGFNGGINYKFSPGKRTCPVIGAMYGYNGVIKIVDGVEASKTYYGPSFSMGLEVKSKKKINNNFWSFALLIPIRPSEFDADINRLKNSGYDVSEPLPIAFSIGLHFGMK